MKNQNPKFDGLTVGELRKLLEKYPDDLPVFHATYVNRSPYDGEETDMSSDEPCPLKERSIQERDNTVGFDLCVKGKHLYIDLPSVWDYDSGKWNQLTFVV